MISAIDVLVGLIVFGSLYTIILWHVANYLGFKRGLDAAFKTMRYELKKLEDERSGMQGHP